MCFHERAVERAIDEKIPMSIPSPFARWHVSRPGDFEASLDRLLASHPASLRVIVTDGTVRALHAARFPKGLPIVEIGQGEAAKSWQSVEKIATRLLDLGVDRQGALLAIGGGIACDVTAFAAATWMRGIGCGLVPTTLLAQADAGIGGKSGINFMGRKNMIGAFHPADFCLCDPLFLATLARRDVAAGLAEIAKHAALFDGELFSFLEAHAEELLDADPTLTARVVERSLDLKAGIVATDPFERGARRQLNFGHTLGHAVEFLLDLRHGEAVAIGMRLSARLSADLGKLTVSDVQRLDALLDRFDLPGLNALAPLSPRLIGEALGADKKRDGDVLHFVMLTGIGTSAGQIAPVALGEIETWLCQRWHTFIDERR